MVKLINSGTEAGQKSIEIIVCTEETCQLILDGLEQIISAITMRDECGPKIDYFVICGGEILLSNLYVSHGEISKRPTAIRSIS